MTQAEGGAALSRDQGITLWRQIARAVEGDITSGTLAIGAKLPTEAELSARFAVNRHTVRRALEELQRQGLVRVEQGRGSFVAEESIDYEVVPRTRFSEWIRRHNKEPSGQVLEVREVVAEAAVAAALGLRGGARVVRFERLGLADAMPVSLSMHYFPQARLPGLAAALQASGSVTAALAACGVPDYLRQSTRVTARLPHPREAELLRLPRTRPLLVAENINVEPDGTVIEFTISRYPTPRVQMVFEP